MRLRRGRVGAYMGWVGWRFWGAWGTWGVKKLQLTAAGLKKKKKKHTVSDPSLSLLSFSLPPPLSLFHLPLFFFLPSTPFLHSFGAAPAVVGHCKKYINK